MLSLLMDWGGEGGKKVIPHKSWGENTEDNTGCPSSLWMAKTSLGNRAVVMTHFLINIGLPKLGPPI